MTGFLIASLFFPPCLLISLAFLPSSWIDPFPVPFRRAALVSVGLTWWVALFGATSLFCLGTQVDASIRIPYPFPWSMGIYGDALSILMYLLIASIGWVIVRYSIRYLDSDPSQPRFLKWTCFTLGSVLLVVVSPSLIQWFAAWSMTSFGLHRLLLHYPERPAAIRVAHEKFFVSRLGDLFLIAALYLTYATFGTFHYADLFALAKEVNQVPFANSAVSWIGLFFALGAMTKSAQVPFHGWLPNTMETPTPVSALMHAGIINAGGFLMIRMSPVVSLSQVGLATLALIGALTAVFGAMVMLTQTSIKRSLAYSTIAQMGLMLFQCGIGAYSTAFLHLIAHSLYKAYAFLNSGNVLQNPSFSRRSAVTKAPSRTVLVLLGAIGVAAGMGWLVEMAFLRLSSHGASHGVLTYLLSLSLAFLLWRSMLGGWRVGIRGLLMSLVVSAAYVLASIGFDRILASTSSSTAIDFHPLSQSLHLAIAILFTLVFLFHVVLMTYSQTRWMKAFYVHASNGFYIDLSRRGTFSAKRGEDPKF